ncbi:MAG: cupin domain-containing protein [Brumimicrobium sp.]
MEKIVIPTVTELAKGERFVAKEMAAKADEIMPKHHANMESILFIYQGECIIKIEGKEIHLKSGEAVSIPALTKHQIKAITDYKGIHFMPQEVKFTFFK